MKCPKCGKKTRVLRTWNLPSIKIRTRKCKSCGFEFDTRETDIDLSRAQLVIPA